MLTLKNLISFLKTALKFLIKNFSQIHEWPFGNLGIVMSALALASASALEYKDYPLHCINRL